MSDLQSAIRYSLEGPLHKAIHALEEVLHSNPSEETAVLYLADVYCRLGRYEEALSLFSKAHKYGNRHEVMEREHRRIAAVWEDLKKVERVRFQKKMFLSHAIVPNGKGGYYVDSLGFPGTWDMRLNISAKLSPGAYLRFFKSLAWVTQQIRSKKIALPQGYTAQQFDYGGDASVEENLEENISISFLKTEDNLFRWNVAVDVPFLLLDRDEQRLEITRRLSENPLHIRSEYTKIDSTDLSTKLPGLVLISPGLSSDYAIVMLRDRSIAQGIPAVASHIRSHKHVEDYLDMYCDLPELDHEYPDIFGIGVLDVMVEDICLLIEGLRRKFPHAHIILGGPTSQTPEQFAAVVPDFDLLIRGDADEIFPLVAKIIGKTSRLHGLSEIQLSALKKLPGGLIIQHKNRRIVHRLDFTNIPKQYHLPRPHRRKTIYYWQTSRGCPYDCRFCYKWSGKRYHMVVPWEAGPAGLSPAKQSALAMKEFLLSRLALEWPDGILTNALERLLRKAKTSHESLCLPKLKEKIFIVIEDDDFLINRERVKEFMDIVTEIGLQNYFQFSAITSVRTLYRGGDAIDQEILEWLRKSNFTSLDIGSDGLCRRTIEENQKGYTLDRHVIPLNAHLKQMGYFAFNNTIITTPYTMVPHLIESLIFYILCPYPINIAIQFGIMGHIGTKYTNEDIVNQQYEWGGREIEGKGHAHLMDRYRVPVDFPEYAINSSHMIGYADPKVFDLVMKLPQNEPSAFLRSEIPKEELKAVVNAWAEASDDYPEIKALGQGITLLLNRNETWDIVRAILTIKEEMSMLDLSSFVQYYQGIKENKIRSDPRYQWIAARMQNVAEQKKNENWPGALENLEVLIEKTPWYFRPHRELIMILMNEGRIASAVESFSRYQLLHPDMVFYFMFFSRFLETLNLDDIHGRERALFHFPRYYTISPIYYFIGLLKDFARGEDIREFCFSKFSPQDVERLYDLFEFLTIDTMKQVVAETPFDISEELKSGKEIYMMGIPVKYLKGERKVFLDYHRIRNELALEIRLEKFRDIA